jgi:site-specific recombinase XerD
VRVGSPWGCDAPPIFRWKRRSIPDPPATRGGGYIAPRKARKKARKHELPERLTREEAAALIGQPSRRYPTGVRDRAVMRLMYRGGLRVSEALALTPRDVGFARNEIRVNDGKGGKDRIVWVDETSTEILRQWGDLRPRGSFFFSTLRGRQLSDRDVRAMVARRALKAGIRTHVHPHMLRHTFASEYLEDGGALHELKELMGHEDIRTTEIYLHLANERVRQLLINRPG